MLKTILWALWFFGPAGAGNVAPLVAGNIPLLSRFTQPVDGGKSWRGRRLLGDHKTWRGLIAGTLFGALAGLLQVLIARSLDVSFIPRDVTLHYTSFGMVGLGALLGLGALVGDCVESFFKRQIGIASGKSWFPFDQIDYIIGACLVSLAFVRLPLTDYVWVFVAWFGMHLLFSYIGYLIHWKEDPI